MAQEESVGYLKIQHIQWGQGSKKAELGHSIAANIFHDLFTYHYRWFQGGLSPRQISEFALAYVYAVWALKA